MLANLSENAAKSITLKGSVEIVSEFFWYAINTILYQRGLFPPEDFSMKQKYGLHLLVTSDEGLQDYLTSILGQVKSRLLD